MGNLDGVGALHRHGEEDKRLGCFEGYKINDEILFVGRRSIKSKDRRKKSNDKNHNFFDFNSKGRNF